MKELPLDPEIFEIERYLRDIPSLSVEDLVSQLRKYQKINHAAVRDGLVSEALVRLLTEKINDIIPH